MDKLKAQHKAEDDALLQGKDEEMAKLKEQMEKLKAQHKADDDALLQGKDDEMQKLRDEIKALKGHEAELMKGKDAELDKFQEQIALLRAQHEKDEKSLAASRSEGEGQIKQYQDQIKKLKNQHERDESMMNKMHGSEEIELLQKKISLLQGQHERDEDELGKGGDQIKMLQKKVDLLAAQKKELEDVDGMMMDGGDGGDIVQALPPSRGPLRSGRKVDKPPPDDKLLKEKEAENTRLKERLDLAEQLHKAHDRKIQEKNQEISGLMDDMAKMREENDKKLKSYKEQIQACENELKAYEAEMEKIAKQHKPGELKKKIADLEAENDSLHRRINNDAELIEKCHRELKDFEDDFNKVQKQLEEKEEQRNADLRPLIEACHRALKDFEDDFNKKENEMGDLLATKDKELDKLRNDLAEVEDAEFSMQEMGEQEMMVKNVETGPKLKSGRKIDPEDEPSDVIDDLDKKPADDAEFEMMKAQAEKYRGLYERLLGDTRRRKAEREQIEGERILEQKIFTMELEAKYAQAAQMLIGLQEALAVAQKKHQSAIAAVKSERKDKSAEQKRIEKLQKEVNFVRAQNKRQRAHIHETERAWARMAMSEVTIERSHVETMSQQMRYVDDPSQPSIADTNALSEKSDRRKERKRRRKEKRERVARQAENQQQGRKRKFSWQPWQAFKQRQSSKSAKEVERSDVKMEHDVAQTEERGDGWSKKEKVESYRTTSEAGANGTTLEMTSSREQYSSSNLEAGKKGGSPKKSFSRLSKRMQKKQHATEQLATANLEATGELARPIPNRKPRDFEDDGMSDLEPSQDEPEPPASIRGPPPTRPRVFSQDIATSSKKASPKTYNVE